MNRLGVEPVVLVRPSAYGTDNRSLLDGLARLGERGRGVGVIAGDCPDETVSELTRAGVRGVRIHASPSIAQEHRLVGAGRDGLQNQEKTQLRSSITKRRALN